MFDTHVFRNNQTIHTFELDNINSLKRRKIGLDGFDVIIFDDW